MKRNKELTEAFGKRYRQFCSTRSYILGTHRNVEVLTTRFNKSMEQYIKEASNESAVHSEDGYDPLQAIVESYCSDGEETSDT